MKIAIIAFVVFVITGLTTFVIAIDYFSTPQVGAKSLQKCIIPENASMQDAIRIASEQTLEAKEKGVRELGGVCVYG